MTGQMFWGDTPPAACWILGCTVPSQKPLFFLWGAHPRLTSAHSRIRVSAIPTQNPVPVPSLVPVARKVKVVGRRFSQLNNSHACIPAAFANSLFFLLDLHSSFSLSSSFTSGIFSSCEVHISHSKWPPELLLLAVAVSYHSHIIPYPARGPRHPQSFDIWRGHLFRGHLADSSFHMQCPA